jgi:hypothetical protein
MHSTVHRLEAALCAAAVGLLLTGCGGPGSSAPALPEPADGTDLAACADGRCEVAVRAGDTIAFTGDEVALKSFTVVRVAGNALTHKAAGPPGYTFSGSMSASGTSVVNGLKVKIVAVDGDRAVIRMS